MTTLGCGGGVVGWERQRPAGISIKPASGRRSQVALVGIWRLAGTERGWAVGIMKSLDAVCRALNERGYAIVWWAGMPWRRMVIPGQRRTST